jgi:hypothetical protein
MQRRCQRIVNREDRAAGPSEPRSLASCILSRAGDVARCKRLGEESGLSEKVRQRPGPRERGPGLRRQILNVIRT